MILLDTPVISKVQKNICLMKCWLASILFIFQANFSKIFGLRIRYSFHIFFKVRFSQIFGRKTFLRASSSSTFAREFSVSFNTVNKVRFGYIFSFKNSDSSHLIHLLQGSAIFSLGKF